MAESGTYGRDGGRSAFARFCRRQDGAAALEFAIVAAPFLFLLFAILDLALAFIAGGVLENATQDISRRIMIGQAKAEGWNATVFRDKMCPKVSMLMKCGNLRMDVRSYGDFGSLQTGALGDPSDPATPPTQFSAGTGGAIMVVRIAYPWPTYVPNFGLSVGATPSGQRLLLSTATFRNEPF